MKTKHDHDKSCHHHRHAGYSHQGIESHRHDDALVCSGNRNIIGDLDTVKEKMVSEIKILADWIQETGGLVGHVKALFECDSPVTMISTTGGEVTVKEMPGAVIHVSVVAIVFNTNAADLECRVASLFDEIARQSDQGEIIR